MDRTKELLIDIETEQKALKNIIEDKKRLVRELVEIKTKLASLERQELRTNAYLLTLTDELKTM